MIVDFLFLFFSALTLIGALSVVLCRDAVAGVMSMIVSFIGMSGLFLLLDAFMLAILQVFVYAGAVMVLFLFVVMLLNIEVTSVRRPDFLTIVMSFLGASIVAGIFVYYFVFDSGAVLLNLPLEPVQALPAVDEPLAFTTASQSYGCSLFTKYLLPVQIAGLLLLLAVVGVVHIAKDSSHDA